MVIDPSFGRSATSSETAIIILAIHRGIFYIVDIIIKDTNTSQLEEEIKRMHRVYNPLRSWVENDFSQISTRHGLYDEIMKLRGMDTFMNRGFGDKESRIETLHRPFKFDQFKIYSTATHRRKFLQQHKRYDQRKGKYDGLDVCASAYRLLADKLYNEEGQVNIVRL
jgi:phage terminase large subunit-like protein